MKIKFLLIIVVLGILFFNNTYAQYNIVCADSLINNIDYYQNKQVIIEGKIIHICGVDGKKMKLQTDSGEIIKIISKDTLFCFDSSFYKQRIVVWGVVTENRIEKSYIDSIKNDIVLLCHIDHTPCKDSIWIENMINTGAAVTKSKKDIEKLNKKMEITGEKYISVITIIAEKIEFKSKNFIIK